MHKAGGILLALVALMIAGAIAQRIMPTMRNDPLLKRMGYRYVVLAVFAGMLGAAILLLTALGS